MGVDLTKTAFYSELNYLKRDSTSGSTPLTLPAYGGTVSTSITHNLGNILFEVLCDIDGNGTIWAPTKINAYTETSLQPPDPTYPTLLAWNDGTSLTIQLVNNTSPVATGTRTVYYVIYRDYTNV